jgi:serine phosphatase RsbU (regulator of sigma subunit)
VEDGGVRALVADGVEGRTLKVRCGEGIVGTVAQTGEPILLDDPYSDPRFDPSFDRKTGFTTRSLLTVPIRDHRGELVALLQLLNHHRGHFDAEDVAFLAELGVPFAIALRAARMHGEIVRRERLQEELRLAGEIQQTLRPRRLDTVPGLEIVAWDHPCLEVGGDYYDLIPQDSGAWWLVMADISGKGVSAGLIASNLQAYLWSRRNDRRSIDRVVAEGNDLLHGLARGRKFATLILAEWHPETRELHWVGAGHPPMLVCRGRDVITLESTGRPVGLLPSQEYAFGAMGLEPGDVVLMFTDGVIEAGMMTGGEELGLERLVEEVRGSRSGREAIARIQKVLQSHLAGEAPDDDVTVLCYRYLPPGGQQESSHGKEAVAHA